MEHGADNDGNESPVKAYLDSVIPGFRLYLQPLFALRSGVFFLRKSLNGTLKRCLILMLHPPVARSVVGPPEVASCLLPPRSAAQPELPPKHNHHIHYITAFICYIPSSNPAQLMLPQKQPPPSSSSPAHLELPHQKQLPPCLPRSIEQPHVAGAPQKSKTSPCLSPSTEQPLAAGVSPCRNISYLPLSIGQADEHD